MNAVAGCDICKYQAVDNVGVLETDHWQVVLSPDQGYLGHSYVYLKDHKPSLSELTSDEWADLHSVIKEFEPAVRDTFGAELFNWVCLMNDAFKAAQPQPHVHWKVRPRYRIPVTIAARTFTDPNFGHHYDKQHVVEVDRRTQEAIAAAIKEHL